MAVPETAVDKEHPPSGAVGKVRRTRKVAVLDAIAHSQPVQCASNAEFSGCIVAADRPHDSRTND